MGDHSLGASLYGLKALKLMGKNYHSVKVNHLEKLNFFPKDLQNVVIETYKVKAAGFML